MLEAELELAVVAAIARQDQQVSSVESTELLMQCCQRFQESKAVECRGYRKFQLLM